jgi:two-component system response regulator FixJ
MTAAPVVFVVDDDRSFLTSVTRLLRAAGHTVESFTSGSELLARLSGEVAGCVIADLRMPRMGGLELQQAIARCASPLPVVFLSGQGDIPSSVTALKHGAEDFLTKRAPKAELLDAVARALARDAREREQRARRAEDRARFERLTPRERQVLAHVVQGRPNKQIAWALSIHERTVKLHRTNITAKLGIASVAELTRWAQETGILADLDAVAGICPKGQ